MRWFLQFISILLLIMAIRYILPDGRRFYDRQYGNHAYSYVLSKLSNWGQIPFTFIVFFQLIFKFNKNTPYLLALYLLNWFILIFGTIGTIMNSEKIKSEYDVENYFIFLITAVHLVFILPLVYWIPYKNKRISTSTLTKTTAYLVGYVSLYLYYVKDRDFQDLYPGFPVYTYGTIGILMYVVMLNQRISSVI